MFLLEEHPVAQDARPGLLPTLSFRHDNGRT
jgi:hypothetical protein